jgi:hypothetical protein
MAYMYFEPPAVSLKKPPNRELEGDLFLIEKFYKEHREQIANAKPFVDDRIRIPVGQSMNPYRVLMEKIAAKKIDARNREIYRILEHVDKAGSEYTVEQRRHNEIMDSMKVHFDRLNLLKRETRVREINASNSILHQRLGRVHARPELTRKETEKCFKNHLKNLRGR